MIKFLVVCLLITYIFTQWSQQCTQNSLCQQNGQWQGCYNGGINQGGACVTTYCTTTCGGATPTQNFPLNINPNDWTDYVTMQGVFQPSGGSALSTVKDCSAIAAYRYNVVAWGAQYNVATIIDARVSRLATFCSAYTCGNLAAQCVANTDCCSNSCNYDRDPVSGKPNTSTGVCGADPKHVGS